MKIKTPKATRHGELRSPCLEIKGDADPLSVAFLAGPGAAYITGVTLHVNGGMYME